MSEVVLSGFGRRDHTRSGNKQKTQTNSDSHINTSPKRTDQQVSEERGACFCVSDKVTGTSKTRPTTLNAGNAVFFLGFF